jgi:hypothetical protein
MNKKRKVVPPLWRVLVQDPDVPNRQSARWMVVNGRVYDNGIVVVDPNALDKPPAGDVKIRNEGGIRSVRPADPVTVRQWLRRKAQWTKGNAKDWSDAQRPDGDGVTARSVNRVAALMGKALDPMVSDDESPDLQRHSVLSYVFDVQSTKSLLQSEANALTAWLQTERGSWEPNATAAEECRRLLRAALEEAGQTALKGM